MQRLTFMVMLSLATSLNARELPVPPDKGWQHAATGLILTSQLAGLRRTGLTDATDIERDVVAQFETADTSEVATIYIFHAAIPDAALWFDRSRMALTARDTFRDAAATTDGPAVFAASGAGTASSLRQSFNIPQGEFRSTALAVTTVGEWIVAIRMSARTLTAAALDNRLQELAKAVRWPTAVNGGALPAKAIETCTKPLGFTKAKLVKPDSASVLITLLASTAAAKQKTETGSTPAAPAVWCRDGDGRPEYGVYRSDQNTTGYVLALYDAGRVVNVQPSLMDFFAGKSRPTYSVSLEDVDGTVSSFSAFTSLPFPEQVWNLVSQGEPAGSARGNDVSINSKPR